MKMRFLKLCSIVLILALLLNLLPMQAIAQELDEIRMTDASGETLLEESTTEEFAAASEEIIAEIPEKRTAFTKEYKLSNGFQMSVVYPEVVHYEKDGQWKEIDNTLKVSGSGNDRVYTNAAGGWNVILPQQMRRDNYVSIVKDGYTVSFGMAGELRSTAELMSEGDNATRTLSVGQLELTEETMVTQMQMATAQVARKALTSEQTKLEHPEIVREKLYSRLTYEDIYNNVDIIYDLNGYQLKESVVLGSYDAAVRGYQYNLVTGTLIPVLNEDGSIDLLTQTDREAVMTMPAPYMIDSAGNVSYDVTVSLTPSNGSYLLTYRMPSNWLADPDRAWPVVLDPVIVAESHWDNILDQFVAENYSPSYTAGSLYCGYHHDLGKMRAFLQYVNLPALTSADVIVHAELSLQYLAGGSENTSVIEAHKVNTTWDSQTITWQTQPAHSPTVEDYATINGDNRYYWSITELVRDWYATSNKGVVLKAPESVETGGVTNWKKFYSVDYSMYAPEIWPYLSIVYRNTNGLESYWDYTTTSAGRAGTGYVNNYSGNLTFVRDDIGFGGNLMPVTIRHVYNSNDSAVDPFGIGYGWRTNFNQLVYQWTENPNYYIWEDADGTKHYFLYNQEENKYFDEDGLELTLTVTGSGTSTVYCITDKYDNASYFDYYGRLYQMKNNQQTPSSITITYTMSTGKYIWHITDGAGRKYTFRYGGATLREITYYGTGTTAISHVDITQENGQLKRIADQDGESCYYTYGENNLLISAQDVDGYKLEYTYSTTTPKKVVGISESDGTAQGGTLAFSYTQNQTILTDHNLNSQVIQFNNWGNVLSVQDNEGNAQFAQYAANWHGETGGKGNQLALSSKLQNTVGNLQHDNSFEKGVAWRSLNTELVTGYVTTAEAYMGSKSLAMVRETSGALSGMYSPWFSIPAGETYTFSAYVKTGTGNACLIISNGSTMVYSDFLPANSDWTRLEVSFTNSTSASTSVTARVETEQAGTVYMDCAQFERAPTASRYNLIDNGDFRVSGTPAYNWTGSGLTTSDTVTTGTVAAPELNTSVFKITGSSTAAKKLSQTIAISGAAGDSYVLSGWAKGDSVPLRKVNGVTREFGLKLTFHNTDGTKDTQSVSFNCDLPSDGNWQYAATPAAAKKAYSSVTVELVYSYNANTVYFDGIQLYKEAFGSSYTYDADGNITSVKDQQSQTTTYEYTDNNLTKEILPTGAELTYTYDSWHNVKTATTEEGVVYHFAYDTYGNNTSVSIGNGTAKITSSATYTADGNRLVSTKDALDKTTTYSYNIDTNVLEWVQYPGDSEDTRTEYSYDSMYRLTSVAADVNAESTLTASYTYTDDLLSKIVTGSTTYNFTYGSFALRSAIQVGNRELASYTYTAGNNYLEKLEYGNDDFVQYTYDAHGRVTQQTFESGETVTYKYDNSGILASLTDSGSGITTTYYYDFTGRLMKYKEIGSSYSHVADYQFDDSNNLSQLFDTILGTIYRTYYYYDTDNRIQKVKDGSVQEIYTYDDYGRISEKAASFGTGHVVTDTITYRNPTTASTSGQVSTLKTTAAGYNVTYTYTYGDNGNILSISDGSNTTSYVYDSANQLIRENNQAAGKTWVWTYDNAGNIVSRKEYAYTIGAVGTPTDTAAYTYGDSEWGDLLTAYDGNTISSDAIGNMLSDGSWTYSWERGRRLASMTAGSATWSYTYNNDGMRIKRTDGTTTYTYFYNGDLLRYVDINGTKLYFVLDASGQPIEVSYVPAGTATTQVYYYVMNLQGDVTAILDTAGNPVVQYTYDAWGNILSVTGSMASTLGMQNPFRYRGYVYDTETGLYYVSSRYYDPEIGRWINADIPETLTADFENFAQYNLFAYCFNNPVNMSDETGTWPSWAKKVVAAVAVVAVVAAVAAVTVATAGAGTAAAVIAVGAAKGAAIGMASGAAIGAATGAVSHRVSTGSWSGAGTAALNGMGDGALSGAVTGAITGAAGSAVKVSQAAKAWDSGTFKSGYQSMKYHYNKHVVSEGLTKGNNVLKYTQDAVRFANRNSSVLKYTYNYNYGNASWNLTYSTGQGGMFTSAGKILTFWYR